ncbi:MAG TPA: NADH-quinone oxidoreductase subunit J [Acidimicrobiales bacterium]
MLTFAHGAIITQLAATHASWSDIGTFVVAAAIVLAGAIGVVIARNPVHAALMLVMTLFGIAVLFVLQRADFLAAVQVIVYAGAIVVLFLFVIMFLGVDKTESVRAEPLRGQRPLAAGLVALALAGVLILGLVSHWTTGKPSVAGPANGPGSNVFKLGHSVFTTYLFPFEVTSALLVIAVVGAVVLARRPPSGDKPVPDAIDATGEAFESAGDSTGDVTASTTGEGIDSTTATIDEEVAP